MRTTSEVPLRYNAVDVLERNLSERSEKVAVYAPSGEFTYAQVSEQVNRVANALVGEIGIEIGDFVALLSPDLPEWVAAFFGTIKAGGVAVGLNTTLTGPEYAYILGDSRARALIVHESLLPTVAEIPFPGTTIVIGDSKEHSTLQSLVDAASPEAEAADTHRDDYCMLNYSSGTTGEPKGIPHAHKDLPLCSQNYAVDTLGVREDDRTGSVAKLFFTYGTCGNLIYPFYAGGSSVVNDAPSRSAKNVLEMIDRFKPTVLHGVPTSYASMLAVDGFPESFDLSSLRLCLSAGEALPTPIWHAWKEATDTEIVEGIGTTENLALFLTNTLDDNRPGSTGKPVSGYEIKLVDDSGEAVPQGETGNLMVRGETAALSYLHQYEKSRNSFRGEWLFTGDLYREDEDGYFWYVGRSDDMLKVGGIWVSPLEIEDTLTGHEAVLETAVIGHADSSDLVKPLAFVVLNKGFEASDELAAELIEYCATEMARYKRPRWVEFVDALPRGATGKVQRARLTATQGT
jgi:benzoate-CoA ligase family protein